MKKDLIKKEYVIQLFDKENNEWHVDDELGVRPALWLKKEQ